MIATEFSKLGLVLLLVLWATGCASEALVPGTLDQTFELRSIGGRAVPAVYDSSAYGYAITVRGSFKFSGEGSVLWTWQEHEVFRPSLDEPFRESTYSYQTTLPYTLDGIELKIGGDCPPDPASNCAAPMTGRIAGATLLLNPSFSRAEWLFVRVDS
jgi:hypothetical protein